MFNGIGLRTPRGSGTNGYVQRSLATLPQTRIAKNGNQADTITRPRIRADPEILLHERLRGVEVKLMELRIKLEGTMPLDDIEKEIAKEREILLSQLDTNTEDMYNKETNESHALAATKAKQLDVMQKALKLGHNNYNNKRIDEHGQTSNGSSKETVEGTLVEGNTTDRNEFKDSLGRRESINKGGTSRSLERFSSESKYSADSYRRGRRKSYSSYSSRSYSRGRRGYRRGRRRSISSSRSYSSRGGRGGRRRSYSSSYSSRSRSYSRRRKRSYSPRRSYSRDYHRRRRQYSPSESQGRERHDSSLSGVSSLRDRSVSSSNVPISRGVRPTVSSSSSSMSRSNSYNRGRNYSSSIKR